MESIKQLYHVFTNKVLFVDWILEILKAITLYFLKVKAGLEGEKLSKSSNSIDMRNTSPAIKRGMVYDADILKQRWDACSSCEFLTQSDKCTKCGCFMKVKHKLAMARCPIGKWGQYSPPRNNFKTHAITR